MYDKFVPIKKGEIFLVTSGEYSDFDIRGHFVAQVDLTAEMIREVETLCNSEGKYNQSKFLPELTRRGWIEDTTVREIYIGNYQLKIDYE